MQHCRAICDTFRASLHSGRRQLGLLPVCFFKSGLPLWSPSLLPCTPAARPGSPLRPSAPHPPDPTPLALHLWAGHLQWTRSKANVISVWTVFTLAQHAVQDTALKPINSSDMTESLISSFQLCKWKVQWNNLLFPTLPFSLRHHPLSRLRGAKWSTIRGDK